MSLYCRFDPYGPIGGALLDFPARNLFSQKSIVEVSKLCQGPVQALAGKEVPPIRDQEAAAARLVLQNEVTRVMCAKLNVTDLASASILDNARVYEEKTLNLHLKTPEEVFRRITGTTISRGQKHIVQYWLSHEVRVRNLDRIVIIADSAISQGSCGHYLIDKMLHFCLAMGDTSRFNTLVDRLIEDRSSADNKENYPIELWQSFCRMLCSHYSDNEIETKFSVAKRICGKTCYPVTCLIEAAYRCTRREFVVAQKTYASLDKKLAEYSLKLAEYCLNEKANGALRKSSTSINRRAHFILTQHEIETLRKEISLYDAQRKLLADRPKEFRTVAKTLLSNLTNNKKIINLLIHRAKCEFYLENYLTALDCLKEAEMYLEEHVERISTNKQFYRKIKFLEISIQQHLCSHEELDALVEECLIKQPYCGRFLAIRIQLMQQNRVVQPLEVFNKFKDFLSQVNSGELYCEYARWHMNPHYEHFDLAIAKRYLEFAMESTAQFADSYIEYLRLLLLTNRMDERDALFCRMELASSFWFGEIYEYGVETFYDTARDILLRLEKEIREQIQQDRSLYQHRPGVKFPFEISDESQGMETSSRCTMAIEDLRLKMHNKPRSAKIWKLLADPIL